MICGDQKAYLLYDDRAIMESPISAGRYGHLTPDGTFTITDKDLNHTSSIYGKIIDDYGRTVVADADVDMPVGYGARFVNAPLRYYMQLTSSLANIDHRNRVVGFIAYIQIMAIRSRRQIHREGAYLDRGTHHMFCPRCHFAPRGKLRAPCPERLMQISRSEHLLCKWPRIQTGLAHWR
jgi:hypothetical protein